MKKIGIFWFVITFFYLNAQEFKENNNKLQNQTVYELQSRQIPILVGSSLIYSFGNNLTRKKLPLNEQEISFLNRSSINSFDRWATFHWSPTISKISDVTVILSATATPLMFTEKKIRKEWFTIGFMYLEATISTYGLTQLTKGLTHRYRPYVYNPEVPFEEKLNSDAKNSFFSGHTALTATYSFLTYKIYSDFFPKSKLKPYFLSGAIALPLVTGTARILSGKHYLSDVITGYAVGTFIGYGLPYLFKTKKNNSSSSLTLHVLILPF